MYVCMYDALNTFLLAIMSTSDIDFGLTSRFSPVKITTISLQSLLENTFTFVGNQLSGPPIIQCNVIVYRLILHSLGYSE